MFSSRETLCGWGIHRHNKEVRFCSEDTKFSFLMNICPHCKRPSGKTLKILFGKQIMLRIGLLSELRHYLVNMSTGGSDGENQYVYQSRVAKDLLEKLGGEV